MNRLISPIVNAINKLDTRILIFLVLFFFNLKYQLSFNGEQYLPYAKQFADPNWMPHSFWFNDFAGTRLVFQAAFGWVLKFMSMEWFTLLGNTLIAILFTPALSRLFRYFELSNLQALFWLQVIWIKGQPLFAEGWMFGPIETKVFAYYFIVWGIIKALEKKYLFSTIMLLISMYFHVLVGFWYSAVIFIWFLTNKVKFKSVLGYGVIFTALLAPLLYYLSAGLLGTETVINGINTDWIYVYVRNPHHLVVFESWKTFKTQFLFGIIQSLIYLYFCIRFIRKYQDEKMQTLSKLIIALIAQLLLFVVVGAFDSNGAILKTYPYRTSVLASLLMLINIQRALNLKYPDFWTLIPSKVFRKARPYIQLLCMVLIANTFITYSIANFKGNIFKEYDKDLMELAAIAKEQTNPEDVFLLVNTKKNDTYFSRFSERDRFFIHKLIPSEKAKIYDWYMRKLAWNEMARDITKIKKYKDKYRIDYVICRDSSDLPWLEKQEQVGPLLLYKVHQ